MPLIAPFKGLRYDKKKVGSLADVVTPPYDVISPEGQTQFYQRHRWNFVRVVFGKGYPTDTKQHNRYSRARQTLEEWIQKGILTLDPEPSVYPYLQEYVLSGRSYRRWGVIALVRLDSPRICPHEETRAEPKLDRLRLLESVEASLSPIFGLIPDAQGQYRRFIVQACLSRPPVAVIRLDGVKHSLWRIGDPGWVKRLKASLRSKELIIADGHHRYESAISYRNARRARNPHDTPNAPYNFAMFYLAAAAAEEPGLLPTHRVLRRLSQSQLKKLLQEMQALNLVQPVKTLGTLRAQLQQLRSQGRLGVGLYTGNGGAYLLETRQGSPYEFDVEWLHQEILPQWIGPQPEVCYTQDLALARRWLRQGKAQALFLVLPPPLQAVLERARSRQRMPGKTTYFYPKPLAGLVEYKFGACP